MINGMDAISRRQFIYAATPASPMEFVDYWSRAYSFPDEGLYRDNITGPPTAESLADLFKWKIGKRFWRHHRPIIKREFLAGIKKARYLCATMADAREFLDAFPDGGVIYRIFWIHCWQPSRFPIYDQHVHRAMTFLLDGKPEELGDRKPKEKLGLYIERFIPFHRRFQGIDFRRVDRALWTFGKFIKTTIGRKMLVMGGGGPIYS
jgi:hypothetical protein